MKGDNIHKLAKAEALRNAKGQLEIIGNNIDALRRVDRGMRMEKAYNDFIVMLQNGEPFTGPQYSFIDGIYETVMKGLGLPSVGLHISKKKPGLRFG